MLGIICVSLVKPTCALSVAPTIEVATNRSIYNVGESIVISIQVSEAASVKTYVATPTGTVTYNIGSINYGDWYSFTASGITTTPGTYTIKAVASFPGWGGAEYSISTVVYVQGAPFDFTMTLSPSTQTIEQGGTVVYKISFTYSDPAYSVTTIIIQDVTGLGSGMNWLLGTGNELQVSTSSTAPTGTYTITVIGSAKGVTRQTTATIVVVPRFEFSIQISPPNQTVGIGDKTIYTVTVSLVSGSASSVSLSLGGLPGGLTHTFLPQTGTPTFTSTMTVDAATASSEGTYNVAVTASSGKVYRTATATLVVRKEDFNLTASPDILAVKKGQRATFNVDVRSIGIFDQTVTLTVTGLPSGASSTFTIPSGKPPFTAGLVVDVPVSTPVGNYTLTIDATGKGRTHSAKAILSVEKKKSSLEISISQGWLGDVTVTGSVKPAVENAEITLSYRGPEDKEVVRKATTSSDGAFKDAYNPEVPGNWTITTKWSGNDEYEGSSSRAEIFQKKRLIPTFLYSESYLPLLIAAVVIIIATSIVVSKRRHRTGVIKPQPTITCPKCGLANAPDDSFCADCGSSLK